MTGHRAFDPGFLKQATGGVLHGEPGGDRVIIDSRGDVAGALFVALPGTRVDGHAFVRDVLDRDAGGAVVSSAWKEARDSDQVVVVADPLQALQDLARAHRLRHDIPLVAITGSNGKTSTKDLLGAALTPLGSTLKTEGNLNNHIGLPLTLLSLRSEHKAGVVEIGLNHPGELRVLAGIARPRVAVITNVAPAHLEGLGSLEGVARAKAEIAESLGPDGILVIPENCPELEAALSAYSGRRLTFGLNDKADVYPRTWDDHGFDGLTLHMADGTSVRCALPGEHSVRNVLAALAAAEAMGVSSREAAPHLGESRPAAGRLRPRRAGEVTVIDDSYNANPGSLSAALKLLRQYKNDSRCWAILGDMLELGDDSAAMHRASGSEAAFLDGLITVGPQARELGMGAVESGLAPERHRIAADGAEAASVLLPDLGPGDLVLVKGSRGMALETAVAALLSGLGGEG